MSRLPFMSIEVDDLTMDGALGEIERLIPLRSDAYVVTPNVDHMVRLEDDESLRAAYADAALVLTDGQPLVWISRLYGTPIREKVSGSDLFPRLCALAAEKGWRMFFFGAADGVADTAAERLREQYPGLCVCGTHAPPLGFENDPQQLSEALDAIRAAQPDLLIVCLGCPKQERFIHTHRHELGVPVSFCLGSVLDMAAGIATRAPRWMSRCGLEWLYRMVRDPGRLIRRYLHDDMRIFRMYFKYRPKKK